VLVRTWNLFHGNTVPPGRHAYLDEMVELASADDPDVLCVQEVPGWALGRFAAGDLAARPKLGSRELGRVVTDLNHGVLRSAVTGQGNAMLVSPRLAVLGHDRLTLNPRRFRDRIARELGLGWRLRLAWAKERRIVQSLRLRAEDGRTFLVANTHCTSHPHEVRIAEAELRRAAWFATSTAKPGDVVVLAGDFNLRQSSEALRELVSEEWGFSSAAAGIDHVLVRGAETSVPVVWPEERRRWRDGRLLSDHAPVEVDIR
jgi:endonuclease/exonuclease/phosphatase family metal-dependent hydrolase